MYVSNTWNFYVTPVPIFLLRLNIIYSGMKFPSNPSKPRLMLMSKQKSLTSKKISLKIKMKTKIVQKELTYVVE